MGALPTCHRFCPALDDFGTGHFAPLPAIADLGRDTLLYSIKRELKEGTSWKLLRKDVTPCKDCPFQLLCPPVSNYDFALNKHNLCTILEEEK